MGDDLINPHLAFLLEQQEADGGFISFSSPTINPFTQAHTYRTTFLAALILDCLNDAPSCAASTQAKQKLVTFILGQVSEQWSFNYWKRSSPEAKSFPYPDDLDDTFCALAAIYRADSKLLSSSALASITSLLTFQEAREGGPYRTWIVTKKATAEWQDVDVAVNANIGYFLSLVDIELPSILALVTSASQANKVMSPYYPSSWPIWYFISRWYRGAAKAQLQSTIMESLKTQLDSLTIIEICLGFSALIYLETPRQNLEQIAEYLTKRPHSEVRQAYAFCLDPAIDGQKHYAGSAALTTAFYVQALSLWNTYIKQGQTPAQDNGSVSQHRGIIKQARRRLSHLHAGLQAQGNQTIDRILAMPRHDEILSLPQATAKALGPYKTDVPPRLLKTLSEASLWGWIAYTLYDDVLDLGSVNSLLLANIALRQLTTLFSSILPKRDDWQDLFQTTLDSVESAQSWELTNCRVATKTHGTVIDKPLPDYGDYTVLANRSLGHALGSCAVIMSLGYTADSQEVTQMMAFFKHSLIAQQLNDDAHDWEDDLRAGHINSVAALLLKKMGLKNNSKPIALKTLIPKMQTLLWDEVILDICHIILSHVATAKKSLQDNPLIADTSPLEIFLAPAERAVAQTLEERDKTLEFLKAYRHK